MTNIFLKLVRLIVIIITPFVLLFEILGLWLIETLLIKYPFYLSAKLFDFQIFLSDLLELDKMLIVVEKQREVKKEKKKIFIKKKVEPIIYTVEATEEDENGST